MSTKIYVNLGILFVFLVQCVSGQLNLQDRIDQIRLGVSAGFRILKNTSQIISLENLGALGRDALYEIPGLTLMEALNKFCSLAILTDKDLGRYEKIKPDYDRLRLILYSSSENTSYSLGEMSKLVENPAFNKNDPVVIMVSGWLSNRKDKPNDPAIAIYNAYKCRGHTNFLLVDTDVFISTLYSWSALNTEEIGKLIAPAIADLINYVNISQIHVVGHSLGAQIAGAVGRHLQASTQKSLVRITGLDPARPCFNQGEALTGLGRGDALFVDVIHTNSGGFGQKEPVGDVDFYPNGVKLHMPGCSRMSCSHSLSWKYYAESVYPGNEYGFLATRCNSIYAYARKLCSQKTIPMGYATPTTAKGNYFLTTNEHPPYGKNSKVSTISNKCDSRKYITHFINNIS
uniref:Lipase domain-containing protein n=1 Tax=Phlebotomus papatasi TaxID=29031 RepID=A0A1B0D1A0_PHLPP